MVFLLTAYAVAYSFTDGARKADGLSLFDDPFVVVRQGIPTLAAMLAFYLRNRSARAGEDRPQYAAMLDVGLAIFFVTASQALLGIFAPDLTLPRWCPSQGALVSWFFLAVLRTLFPPGQNESPLELFEPRFGFVAASVGLVLSVLLCAFATRPEVRFGAGVIAIGLLSLVFRLSNVWLWYFGSLVPGAALVLWNAGTYAWHFMTWILLLGVVIHRSLKSPVPV